MTRLEVMKEDYKILGSFAAVGRKHNLTRERVRQIFKAAGLIEEKAPLSEPQKALIIEMLFDGYTHKQIIEKLHVTASDIKQLRKERGITEHIRHVQSSARLMNFVDTQCNGNATEAARRIGRQKNTTIFSKIKRYYPHWRASGSLPDGVFDDTTVQIINAGVFAIIDGKAYYKGKHHTNKSLMLTSKVVTSTQRAAFIFHYSVVPQDHIVVVKDGNRNNLSKENLEAITRSELQRRFLERRKNGTEVLREL